MKRLFREDPEALAELRSLETGAIAEDEFERRFGARLGLEDSSQLIDSLFAGMVPEESMTAAVRSARAAGVPTALVSNSWSVDHYDREMLAELFDAVVISAEVGMHKPQPEIYLLAAERVGPLAAVVPVRRRPARELRRRRGGRDDSRSSTATRGRRSRCSSASWKCHCAERRARGRGRSPMRRNTGGSAPASRRRSGPRR